MWVKTTYVANDGMEFNTEKECMEYEERVKVITKNAVNFAKQVQKYCQNHFCNEHCIFCNNGDCLFDGKVPEYWEVDDFNI